ncbi:VIR superfamily protein [Cryptosporidium ubiquitum]|uniref:VIR superfamily protein n=1 Tax=Cryptosporidium ubiquitum TaxID=857276 RepID=A0A1J4MME4_9CRYT|nr:VIR superfamily protein [Cryptosporidium ubiquitum]OII75350.1 VIR superfamily protein [Cryptosporidium ubiquitum]
MKEKKIKTKLIFKDDERFNSQMDPRFKPLIRKEHKVKIDKRFSRIFSDDDFSVISVKDPFGKKSIKKDEYLNSIYEGEEKSDAIHDESFKQVTEISQGSSDSEGSFQWEGESDDLDSDEKTLDTSNNLRNTSDSIWENNPLNNMGLAEGSETNRLALMGLDWDNINADDIYVVLSSFLSPSATIKTGQSNSKLKKISIYPSKYGKERMDYESVNGPLIGNGENVCDEKIKGLEFSNEMSEEDYEAIRKYQVEKSLYYYAVVECDCTDTAVKLYDELDGMEAEFCIDGLELRFIPDDIVDFQFEPISVSTSIPIKYKQPECFTSALRHSKPTLNWDDTPIERVKFLRKIFTPEELLKNDFDAYLGSSSENEFSKEGTDSFLNNNLTDNFSSGMREILLGEAKEIFDEEINQNILDSENGMGSVTNNDINELFNSKGKDYNQVEIEFNPDLEDLSMELIAKGKQKWEEASSNEKNIKKQVTPWQAYLEKRKQKKKERKIQLRERIKEQKLQREKGVTAISAKNNYLDNSQISDQNSESSDEDRHFDMKKIALLERSGEKIKSKKRKDLIISATAESTQNNFLGAINDPRISKIFTDVDFAIDPTNPIYKPTEFNKKLLLEKRKQKLRRNSIIVNKSKQQNKNNTVFSGLEDNSFHLLATKKIKKC